MGGTDLSEGLRPVQAMRSVVAFCVGSALPLQVGHLRVAKGSVQGSTSQEKGEGKKIENDSQSPSGARPGRKGEGAHGETVEGIKAPGGLLK